MLFNFYSFGKSYHTECKQFYLYIICFSRLSGEKSRSLAFKHPMKKMMPSML